MYIVSRNEAAELLLLGKEDELAEEIRKRFSEAQITNQEFWHGAMSGLVQAMLVYEKSSMDLSAKQVAIVEMIREAARQFLGVEYNRTLQ